MAEEKKEEKKGFVSEFMDFRAGGGSIEEPFPSNTNAWFAHSTSRSPSLPQFPLLHLRNLRTTDPKESTMPSAFSRGKSAKSFSGKLCVFTVEIRKSELRRCSFFRSIFRLSLNPDAGSAPPRLQIT